MTERGAREGRGRTRERLAESSEGRSGRLYLSRWRIDFIVRPGVPWIAPRIVLARAIRAALETAGAPSPASVGLVLSTDTELAELNAPAMGRREPTDVLSFPLLPASAFPRHRGQQGALPGLSGSEAAFALPPGRRPHLGDIVVSVERAVAQACEGRGGQTGDVRWSPADELRLLVTHGALHLCGWDHERPEEEAAMRELERTLLAQG